jgi:rsbT co-antagonist protein RsbR
MSASPHVHGDPRLHRIRDIVLSLHEGRGDEGPPPGDSDELDHLLAGVEALATEIKATRAAATRTQGRLEELMEVCLALVAFDYDKKASIGDDNDIFDGLAAALNMLGEELGASTVSIAYVDDIFESMSDALIIAEAEQGITRVNQAACTLAALPRGELLGKPLEAILPDIASGDIVARGGVQDEEKTLRAADGKAIPVSFSASILRNKRGATNEVVCVARDLTESKKTEEEQWRLREIMQRQSILVEELSTPIIPITSEVIVIPLVGSFNEGRAEQLSAALLAGVASRGARTAILDITGIRAVDAESVEGIVRAMHAVRLLGAEVLLTGVRADVARILVRLGVNLDIPTFSALQHGVAHALRWRRQAR